MHSLIHRLGSLFRPRSGISMAMVALLLGACAPAEEPTVFSRGETFDLGELYLKVSRTERVSLKNLARIPGLTSLKGRPLAVYFHADGVEDPKRFAGTMQKAFTISDERGRESGPGLILAADAFKLLRATQSMQSMSDVQNMANWSSWASRDEIPRRYVAFFPAPEESRGFTLFIRNPDRREGQPGVAAVPLDR